MAIMQIICGILLLPMLVYVFMSAHLLCTNELALFVSRSQLQWHYALNIELYQIVSALFLLIFSTYFNSKVSSIVGDYSDNLYKIMFQCNLFAAFMCLMFSIVHYRVTRFLRIFEDRVGKQEETIEAMKKGLHLQLIDKNSCFIAHSVDKPSLTGKRGILVGNGVDSLGLVTVMVDGNEMKFQEYQLHPDTSEEKQVRPARPASPCSSHLAPRA